MNTRAKIWDCLSPFFHTAGLLILASAAGLLAASALTGIYVGDPALRDIPWVTSAIDALFFCVLLASQWKFFCIDQMRFPAPENGSGPKRGLAAGLCGFLLLLGLGLLFRLMGWGGEERTSSGLLFLLVTLLLAPAAEEVVFRGMIFRRIRAYFGLLPACLLSAALFGIYHADPIQSVYAFLAGLVLGMVYDCSGSLALVLGLHILHNFLSVLF